MLRRWHSGLRTSDSDFGLELRTRTSVFYPLPHANRAVLPASTAAPTPTMRLHRQFRRPIECRLAHGSASHMAPTLGGAPGEGGGAGVAAKTVSYARRRRSSSPRRDRQRRQCADLPSARTTVALRDRAPAVRLRLRGCDGDADRTFRRTAQLLANLLRRSDEPHSPSHRASPVGRRPEARREVLGEFDERRQRRRNRIQARKHLNPHQSKKCASEAQNLRALKIQALHL